ncbi:hypothetical protein BpHYR1_016490 [Brachionus plicatilis]|uniref:Uncharacterized protein n=1 Tax=Brachionus plicatilis TaxID=10195 RepID=A0A3M7T4Q7_BRAPC|nr:hypothetical protein BpHYR1_016490 [Brachionus plicatilis]
MIIETNEFRLEFNFQCFGILKFNLDMKPKICSKKGEGERKNSVPNTNCFASLDFILRVENLSLNRKFNPNKFFKKIKKNNILNISIHSHSVCSHKLHHSCMESFDKLKKYSMMKLFTKTTLFEPLTSLFKAYSC